MPVFLNQAGASSILLGAHFFFLQSFEILAVFPFPYMTWFYRF